MWVARTTAKTTESSSAQAEALRALIPGLQSMEPSGNDSARLKVSALVHRATCVASDRDGKGPLDP